MRAEDRHKMQQNELAEWLAKWIGRLKPHTNVILLVALVVVAGVGVLIWWTQQSATQASGAWDGFYRALSTGRPEALEEIAAQYPGTDVGHWAAVSAGDTYLSSGCQQLFINKSTASAALRDAVNHYRTVQEESKAPALLERALFGLARAYEALAGTRQSQGELDRAIEAYQELVQKWPNGPYSELAARRLEELSQQETKAFYDQFAQFDPQPALPSVTGLPGAGLPSGVGGLSEEGDFPSLPEFARPDESAEEATGSETDASPPTDTERASSAESDAPAQQEQAGPELAPPQGPAESEQPPGQESAEPEKTPVQGPARSQEAAAQQETTPEMTPAADSAPAGESSDQKPAAADEPSDQTPTGSKEPSGAN